MAESFIYQDGIVFDDRTRRFTLEEFEGWTYTDQPSVLGPRRKALNRGAFRTPAKIDAVMEAENARIDQNTEWLNVARRAGTSVLTLFYSDVGDRRLWYAAETRMEDVPNTYPDGPVTTTVQLMPATDIIQSYPFPTGGTGDFFYPNSGITPGTAFSIGNLGGSAAADKSGAPVIVLDLVGASSLGASPTIEVELAITGATGTPWSITLDENIRDGGLYIANFNRSPVDFDTHPNVAYAANADADQIATAAAQSASAAAATIEITLTNFSGTRTDTEINAYAGREFQREQ